MNNGKKRVALVSPIAEYDMIVQNDVLKVHTTVDPFTGSSVTYREPIALEYIDAYMKQNCYDARLFTETSVTSEQMVKDIIAYRPNIIGISVHSAVVYPDAVAIADAIKGQMPKTKIVLGGYHPSGEIIEHKRGNIARTLLHSPNVDYVVHGEGELSFHELSNAVLDGGDVSNVEGIAFKEGDGIVVTPRRRRVDFASLPWPTRYEEIIKYSRCAPVAYPAPSKQRATAQISTSRGCVYGCDFCPSMIIWPSSRKLGRYQDEPTVSYRPAEDVVAEVKHLKENFGTNFLTFTDLTFNFDHKRAEDLCNQLVSEGATHRNNGSEKDFGWFAYTTVDKTVKRPKTIEMMADAGCSRIGIGLESLHDSILDEHKPNNSYENELKALEIVDSQGILNRSYLMVGWHNETPEMFDEMRDKLLSGELPIDQLRIAFITPFLGTSLFQQYKGRMTTMDWRRFTGDEPVVKNDYMSHQEMRERVKNTLQAFYDSDGYKKHLRKKVRNFPHLRESFKYWEEYMHKRGVIPTSHSLL